MIGLLEWMIDRAEVVRAEARGGGDLKAELHSRLEHLDRSPDELCACFGFVLARQFRLMHRKLELDEWTPADA